MKADESAGAVPQPAWEGDLPTEHLNRCKLRDNLLYADIFNDDGSHRAAWRCHKREGHNGPCSSHNDCGVMNSGRVVCGLLPGHPGPHQWETRISAPAVPSLPAPLDQALEALAFAHGAIVDAVGCEDGLDGQAGAAVLKMIREALTANGRTPPDLPTDDEAALPAPQEHP